MIGVGNDCLNPIYVHVDKAKKKSLRVACGHCINCKIARKKEWTVRLQMEMPYWSASSFVTLTYDESHVPVFVDDSFALTLESSDFTRFMKRFRKACDKPFRYFAVGEYGTKHRPHYHFLVFGLDKFECSALLSKTWTAGFFDVSPVYPETCAYVTGYVQKKLYGDDTPSFRYPEFMHCSKHLGERWLIDNFNKLDRDRPVVAINGFEYVIPRQLRRLASDSDWCAKYGFEPFDKISAECFVDLQQAQLYQLNKFCEGQGTDLQTYFRNRLAIAINHEKRVLSSRVKKGVN